MRPLSFLLLLLGLVLAAPLAAGAGPGGKPIHETFDGTFVDKDFCGTGETVFAAFSGRARIWIGETGGDPTQELKSTFIVKTTFTRGSISLVEHAAGQYTNEIVEGVEDEAHTHRFVEKGLRGKLKLPNGRVLTRDAGQIVYDVSFDEDDEVTGLEVISVSGPHPAFESDAWCEAATEAFGIG